MKNVLIIGLVILAVGVGLFFLLPDSKQTKNDLATTSTSSATQKGEAIINEIKAGKAVMFDVRTPAEFNSNHSSLAQNFDSVLVDSGQFPNVSKDNTIYIYCRSGSRATVVKAKLEQNGFKNVVNLGSLTNMKQMGLL